MSTRVAVGFLLIALTITACRRKEQSSGVVAATGAPVIIISIDTLRADHLPAYGYRSVETPAIDALRRDSILFTNAYAQVPLTLPSHVSLLTGRLPQSHRVRDNLGYKLTSDIPTIPAMLDPGGYESGAAVSAYVLRASTGIGSSFDFFDDRIASRRDVALGALMRPGADTVEIAKQWISGRSQKPFFFLLHLFEPHSPYEPPEPFRSRYPLAYDGEIASADQIAGTFITWLKSEGIYDRAMIVLLSDHGEGLGEHGEPEHGIFLYRESIHVPLIVKLPGNARAGETVADPTGLVDVMPTIAAVTGSRTPEGVQGKSLLQPPAAAAGRRIYSETLYPRIHLGWSELRSLAGADYHFIEAPKPELYDVRSDPAETKNVLAGARRVYASMREELAREGGAFEEPQAVDPEEAKKLAALGYLGSSAPSSTGPRLDPKDGMPQLAVMMHAMKLARDGRHQDAAASLRRIVGTSPDFVDAWNQLAMSLEALGRYDESIAAYRKSLELTPAMAGELSLRMAGVLQRMGRPDEAVDHALLGEKANYGGAHLMIAGIELERKRYARAEEEARKVLGDSQNDLQARVMIARIYGQQDRAAEALAMARDAAAEAERRKSGPVESLYYVVGDALARMQQYGPAEQALRREIGIFPQNRPAYASLYLVCMLTNRPAEAGAALDAMVKANPTRGTALFAAETAAAMDDARTAAMWRKRAAAM